MAGVLDPFFCQITNPSKFFDIRVVFQSPDDGPGLVDQVVLPEEYDEFDVVEVLVLANTEWRTNTFPVALLTSSDIDPTDNIRIGGNRDVSWTVGSRTLTMTNGNSEIYLVRLLR